MYQYPRFNLFVLALFLMMTLTGCPGPATEETGEEADSETKEVLLEPFDAPKLADLDAQVEWEDQPVLDSLELLRERQSQEKPQVTVEEALKLKNTDQEMNEKILSALGRLPENDEQVDWGATINR
ncbi:MAG TPA: peptide ABC transporter substrate-binding protein, partial [Planctomycetaceae bacterium]|nr:peptide ABC transporter substrate-binding protein [Planctomycetaceae bacterium]